MQPMVEFALRLLREAQEPYLRLRERIDGLRQDQKIVQQAMECAQQAELMITRRLSRGYPQHKIVGRFSTIEATQNPDPHIQWIIDPLWAQSNFCAGSSDWAMSIQVQQQARTEHAVVLLPYRGDEYTVSRGRGVQLNRRRMRLTAETEATMRMAIGLPSLAYRESRLMQYQQILNSISPLISEALATGHPFLDLLKLVNQQVDAAFAFDLSENEFAMAVLFLREVGALIGQPDGSTKFRSDVPILASSPRRFRTLIQSLSAWQS